MAGHPVSSLCLQTERGGERGERGGERGREGGRGGGGERGGEGGEGGGGERGEGRGGDEFLSTERGGGLSHSIYNRQTKAAN